jgi:hypothetical protein
MRQTGAGVAEGVGVREGVAPIERRGGVPLAEGVMDGLGVAEGGRGAWIAQTWRASATRGAAEGAATHAPAPEPDVEPEPESGMSDAAPSMP